ncbi:MAG: hypothetical protein ABI134_08815, partial [Byssovorax sp.]
MEARLSRDIRGGGAGLLWLLAVAGYAYTVVTQARISSDHAGLVRDASEAIVFGAALFSASTVGFVVAVQKRRHPVGWLFLALGVAVSIGGAGDTYALDALVVHGGSGTAAELALVVGKASFIIWFAILAAILQLTPTGRPLSRRWALFTTGAVGAGVVGLAAKLVQDTEFETPYAGVQNPWAIPSISGFVDLVAGLAITAAGIGLLVGAASFFV